MAAMYERLVNPKLEIDDAPYNIIALLAQSHFPNISDDIRKLISICYISLYSMEPATVLLRQMEFANANPKMSGLELVTKFIQDSKIVKKDANGRAVTMDVIEFYDYVVASFENVLDRIIGNIPFISESIDRVNISNGFVPIIQILYEDGPLNRDTFKTLMDGCGIPHIYTEFGEEYWPSCIPNKDIASNDVLQLFVLNAMYEYLTKRSYACPLLSCCNIKNDADNVDVMWKDECYGTPWEGRECFMTVVAKLIGIHNKKISV